MLHYPQVYPGIHQDALLRFNGLVKLTCFYHAGGFGIAQFRPTASDFHGSLTIANKLTKAIIKVTCGAARLLSPYHNALDLYN